MRWPLLALIAVVACLPLSLAHEPRGTPKNFCEPGNEWFIHEYGAPIVNGLGGYAATSAGPTFAPAKVGREGGGFALGYTDGNLGGDCSGVFDPGYVCLGLDPEDPVGSLLTGICEFDPPLADFDGHAEYAGGGAWLLVLTGSGEPSDDPSVGAGTLYCFGDEGHHANFGTVTVDDTVLGAGTEVAVAADTVDLAGIGEGCGDFESDKVTEGVGIVTATFGAGLDGTYQVYVRGTQGHITTT